MPVADKIAALFVALTREEVDAMPPAQRDALPNCASIGPTSPSCGPGPRQRSQGS
jgi:hypothetical protein